MNQRKSTAVRRRITIENTSDPDDDEDDCVRKIEDSDDGKSDYSSFSNLIRRRNNANEDDGEDEEFQRVEGDDEYQMEEGVERTE